MIRSVRDKGLKRLFDDDDRRGLPASMIARIAHILAVIDEAKTLEDLNTPSFRLHALKGELKGFHAVSVRANWRIIFRFEGQDAFDVDFVDYH